MAIIHGFRLFGFVRCGKTDSYTLRGQYGMHLHERTQKPAECRGIAQGMWLTPGAKENLKKPGWKHAPEETPHFDCTCGHYVHRTFESLPPMRYPHNVIAHVTCLGENVIHEDGCRTLSYTVDYILKPEKSDVSVLVPHGLNLQMQDYGAMAGYYGTSESQPLSVVLEQISLSLGVPILEKDDLRGCPVCVEVNGWRKPEEITDEMRRQWFEGE